MAMEFNEGQKGGIKAISTWFKELLMRRHAKTVFFMSGQAGTGKTSVAMEAALQCVGGDLRKVAFIAPTGKAASRLREKGCAGARTMHQFNYRVAGEDPDTGEPIFSEKGALDEAPRLVVLDEASMVDTWQMKSLMRHGVPILGLGDLGQLDPVKGAAYFTPDRMDWELTEIMRQAADSNIIRAASFVRQGKCLPAREYPDVQIRIGDAPMDELLAHVGEDSQILCCYNSTREYLTKKMRREMGRTSELPEEGEKIMCWFNQHGSGIMNGEQAILLGYEEVPDWDMGNDEPDGLIYAKVRMVGGKAIKKVKFNPLSFSRDEELQAKALRGVGGFWFGYIATTHKAQGSEWSKVLVLEELLGNYAKMTYTQYTRAVNNLRVYRLWK